MECEGVIEMVKLLADKAEMEAIEKAEKKEISDSGPVSKPMSAVSQMSGSATALNGDQPPDVPESPR